MSRRADLPHYLPAALIGGFGIPNPRRKGARYASVCMRRRATPDVVVGPLPAERIGAEYGVYDVDRPDQDLPGDFAEILWQAYESDLPSAAAALESGLCQRDDWLTILLHIQAQSIRHPDFARVATEHLTGAGRDAPDRDEVQRQRQRTHLESRALLSQARFAVIRRSKNARRFLLNDKGYVSVGDVALGTRGVLFPLTGNVAVLMAVSEAVPGDDFEAGPLAERALNVRGMDIINGSTWELNGITCVIGHPDDAPWIGELEDGDRTVKMPPLGPYAGSREGGMLDWALTPDQVRQRHRKYVLGGSVSPFATM
ncbi:hypothetical protein [Streptacidiphilus carbonis]|uniref:hypothetical protein n=1 Tax=Streptacidiphilus carbonis TaxID=105422 RepID=UPI001269D194|nr:hypothetical protein [Streptacidiphilus carbonis]